MSKPHVLQSTIYSDSIYSVVNSLTTINSTYPVHATINYYYYYSKKESK